MKVLIVMNSLGTGGAERSTADYCRYIKDLGHEVQFFLFEKRKEGIQEIVANEGFHIEYCPKGNFFTQARKIAVKIKSYNPDIVHSILLHSNLRTRMAQLLTHFTHVESLVNTSYDKVRLEDKKVNKLGFYMYKWLDKLTSNSLVDGYAAITNTVKLHYIKELGIKPEKIRVIYRGRLSNHYINGGAQNSDNIKSSLGITPDKLLLLAVGRQEYQKGHDSLAKAIQLLPASIQNSCSFALLGRKGNASDEIERQVQKLPQGVKIHFMGHVQDVPRYLAGADVFLFPSRYEGLGGSVIEAMAAGLPIICSDIEVLKEVIEPGQNALIFPVNDEHAMASAITQLVSDESTRKRFGQRSLELFNERYQLAQVNEQMLDWYKSMISAQ